MKRLLITPLLLSLIVACSNKDKTFIERRDDCAEAASGSLDLEVFLKKYKLGENLPEAYKFKNTFQERVELYKNFCRYYGRGGFGGG